VNLEVSLLPGRSLVDWAKDTGSTRPLLGGGRLGRDTTLNHISDIVELSIPGLALLLLGGMERLLGHISRVHEWNLQRVVHFLYLFFSEEVHPWPQSN